MKNDPTGFNSDAREAMEALGVNFSTSSELKAWADAPREQGFAADSPEALRAWQTSFRSKVIEALGAKVPVVDPSPREVERVDAGDHWRCTIVYRTTEHMWVPAYLLIPKSLEPGVPVPAVLTIHGHGYGACELVGLSPEEETSGSAHHNYALDVVSRGMVALAPDLRGFGRRAVDEDQLGRIISERGDPEA
ncbi:MAG: alpha/beta hydrolase family protein, partial [Planctomycetota bacterium]